MNLLLTFLDNFLLLNMLDLFIGVKKEHLKTYHLMLITLLLEGLILPIMINNATIATIMPILTIILIITVTKIKSFRKITLYTLTLFINLFIVRGLIIYTGALLFNVNLELLSSNTFVTTALSSVSIALFFLEYLYLKTYFQQTKLSLPSGILAVIIAVLTITIILIAFTLSNYVYYKITDYFFLLIIISLIMINFLIWFICSQFSTYYTKSLEQDLYLKSIEYGKELVASISKSTDEHNRLQHDLKHHLVVIKNMIKDDQQSINEYVDNLKISNLELINSGNLIIDYLINEKVKSAKDDHIDFKIFITGIPTTYISDIDMCIILGNMLDNAINGANKCTVNKFINIKIKFDAHKTVIKIINSYPDDHLNIPKKPHNGHGYGLSNIKNTVTKYHGIDLIECLDGTIIHSCVLFD